MKILSAPLLDFELAASCILSLDTLLSLSQKAIVPYQYASPHHLLYETPIHGQQKLMNTLLSHVGTEGKSRGKFGLFSSSSIAMPFFLKLLPLQSSITDAGGTVMLEYPSGESRCRGWGWGMPSLL